MDSIKFQAEVRKVQSKKLVTNDIEYSVTLTGTNPNILALGTIDAETLVNVEVKIDNND
jgi:hypothetical protein